MALDIGSRLGPYEIVSRLGAGGMGEVYRARDTRLDRDVAIKVVLAQFVADAERLARFQREAKTLASLSHPNIGGIHGLEETSTASGSVKALILEFVDGPTLAEVIDDSRLRAQGSGGLPIDDALKIALQICEALEAAHEQGIIHRDLKPANIKLRPDGTVKVLDFGLAKALDQSGVSPASSPQPLAPSASMSPTITTPAMTLAGIILGTAAYMSPEQAKGRPADKRSDIWAFGCVLFEMLSGRRAFEGEDVSDTLALVLRGEPDWNALPGDTPARILELIRGCLQRDRKERVPDIAVGRMQIRAALSPAASTVTAPIQSGASGRRRLRALPLASAAVVGGIVVGALAWSLKPTPVATPPVTRFAIPLGEGLQFSANNSQSLAVSPDGTKIVYVAGGQLYIRSLSEAESRPIPGTFQLPSPVSPVFSPDGQSIAYFSQPENAIKRIGLSGGAAVTVCPAALPFLGASWNASGIFFGQAGKGILRVAASGARAEVVAASKDDILAAPQLLPGGEWLLFTRATAATVEGWDTAQIVVQSLKSGERRTLIEGGSDARYVPTGHLLYALAGVILAVPFDLTRVAVTAGPVPVIEGVRRSQGGGTSTAHLAVSPSGTLVFTPGPVAMSGAQFDIALFDRSGVSRPLKLPPGNYNFPRVSPDGKTIAVDSDDGKEASIWIYDLSGASALRRLTLSGRNRDPVWAPDSQHVAFQSDREGDLAVWSQRADGSAAAERLTRPEKGASHVPESWYGQTLLVNVGKVSASSFILAALNTTDKRLTPLGGVESSVFPPQASFSPDGKWFVYTAAAQGMGSGSLFVQPFPPTGATYPITKGTGNQPVWSRDGKELFYSPAPSQIAVVSVSTKPAFVVGNPSPVPRTMLQRGPQFEVNFDIMPDGKHFVGVTNAGTAAGGSAAPQIEVVLNWFEELKARVPVRR